MAERKSARQRAAPNRPAAKRARETASTPPSRSQVQDAAPAAGVPANPRPFIVGIGASAGGLEALSELLEHLPADSGMVFVVVTHEDPDRVSPLPMLLQRHTDMRVSAISDGMQIAPNQVYVAPPVGQLALFNGAFHLMEVEALSQANDDIQNLLNSINVLTVRPFFSGFRRFQHIVFL